MYHIALCDDEVTELNKTEFILNMYQRKNPRCEFVIDRFENANELLGMIREKDYIPNLVLLDIYMPEKMGITAAKEIRDMGNKGRIIFLTASMDHALDAFRVDATQYLVKPVSEKELFPVLDKILEEIEQEQKKYLLLKIEDRVCRIMLNNIIYCEAQGKFQYLYLTDGTQSQLRMTMAKIYEMLSLYEAFTKVGIAYIVNMEHIESLNSQDIFLDNGKSIHLPRGAYQPLREKYFQYYCGKR